MTIQFSSRSSERSPLTAATQPALFSSLYVLPGRLAASQSGVLVEGAAKSAESTPASPIELSTRPERIICQNRIIPGRAAAVVSR